MWSAARLQQGLEDKGIAPELAAETVRWLQAVCICFTWLACHASAATESLLSNTLAVLRACSRHDICNRRPLKAQTLESMSDHMLDH